MLEMGPTYHKRISSDIEHCRNTIRKRIHQRPWRKKKNHWGSIVLGRVTSKVLEANFWKEVFSLLNNDEDGFITSLTVCMTVDGSAVC